MTTKADALLQVFWFAVYEHEQTDVTQTRDVEGFLKPHHHDYYHGKMMGAWKSLEWVYHVTEEDMMGIVLTASSKAWYDARQVWEHGA